MRVEIQNGMYEITWKHKREGEMQGQCRDEMHFVAFPKGGLTICMITAIQGEEKRIIGKGEAVCSFQDCYCKNTGRKISLSRALKQDVFNKAIRTKIWTEYGQKIGNFSNNTKNAS